MGYGRKSFFKCGFGTTFVPVLFYFFDFRNRSVRRGNTMGRFERTVQIWKEERRQKFVLLLDWGHFFHRLDLIWIIQFMNLISFNISLESIWKCDCNVTSPYHFYLPPIFATVLFICTKQQRTNRYISLHFFFYISVDLSQNRDGTHRADTAKTSLQNDSKKIK